MGGRIRGKIRPDWEFTASVQVDLGEVCSIQQIKVYNRTDKHPDPVHDPFELIDALFPMYIMVSPKKFMGIEGRPGLRRSKSNSVHQKFLRMRESPIIWELPPQSVGRYVRIQIDDTAFLSIAEVEVFGLLGEKSYEAKASSVCCGEYVTMVVVEPNHNTRLLEERYVRAIMADKANEMILRQYPTYAPFWKKYLNQDVGQCRVCPPHHLCDRCEMMKLCETSHLPKGFEKDLMLSEIIQAILGRQPKRDFEVKDEIGFDQVMATHDKKKMFNKVSKVLSRARKKGDDSSEDSDSGSSDSDLEETDLDGIFKQVSQLV